MPGLFIVFEGPDGAGTTLHSRLLAERLRAEGREVTLTAEPTEGQYGQRIRDVLGSGDSRVAAPESLQQLFCADRAEHVTETILPALRAGKIVISDRYIPSTLVYGEASGVSRALLEEWNVGFPSPDLTFVLLPPFEVCRERLARRAERDAFEQEEFQRKVYDGYVRFAVEHPEVRVIGTSGAKEEVAAEVWEVARQGTDVPPRSG